MSNRNVIRGWMYHWAWLRINTRPLVTYNKVTKKPNMRFRVEMWNDKVKSEVA
jgi:hypothetical protein